MPMPRSSLTECCVGLVLISPEPPDDGHQRQMHVQNLVAPELHAHLANGLEEGQRLDVADRAADFDHADIRIAGAHADAVLDFIGDVRDHLHRGAEIVAAALLGDDPFVDAAGGEIAVAARGRAHETLVMAEIEIGLGAVGRDEHFAVLEGTHGAGIHVDVRIELHHADFQAPRLEDGAEGGGCDALAERGNDAAGDENESSHDGSPPLNGCHCAKRHSSRADPEPKGIIEIRREFRLPDRARPRQSGAGLGGAALRSAPAHRPKRSRRRARPGPRTSAHPARDRRPRRAPRPRTASAAHRASTAVHRETGTGAGRVCVFARRPGLSTSPPRRCRTLSVGGKRPASKPPFCEIHRSRPMPGPKFKIDPGAIFHSSGSPTAGSCAGVRNKRS